MLPYLSLAIWVPIVAGLLVLAVNRDRDAAAARWLALVGAVAGFVVTIPLYLHFTLGTAEMQFVETIDWIPRFNVNYLLGVDGISVLFILLNSFITMLAVWAGWVVIEKKVAQYMAAFLIMSGLVNGVFAALDAVLFYTFFEAQLIPMYLIIGIWGGPNRIYAALKFFLYTFLGSVLMLVALIYLYTVSGSFSILEWYQLPLSLRTQVWLFGAFFIAFAVKVPMWPVHTWLPDAHVEAPTGGSVILAAIMLKMGGYGFLRFNLPITPDASRQISDYGGVINTMPIFAAFMVLFALANTGLPGTSGFVGEFLVILASFKASFWYSLLAATTLILGAAYTLWLVKRVVFGPVGNSKVAALTDLNGREFGVLAALAVAVLLVGIWPAPLLKIMQPTIHHLVDQAVASKIPL